MKTAEIFNKYAKFYVAHADIPLIEFSEFEKALAEHDKEIRELIEKKNEKIPYGQKYILIEILKELPE